MKKIYIAGCGGMLGEAFYKVFSEGYILECSDIDKNEDWLSQLDFRDKQKYKESVKSFGPDFLFHLGAHTSLEYCDTNIEDAYLTNTISVETAVEISNELNIPLLYISTAGIFDGTKDTFDDWDTPNPLGHYARSKFMGEKFVQNHANKYIICRAGWMMGSGPSKDKKFIQKLAQQIKSGSNELMIVNDKLGTPTYTIDFANNVKHLIEHEIFGLFNMVCGGVTGRLEVAKKMLEILRLNTKIKLISVDSDYFKNEYFSVRPPSERLINRRLDLLNANIMRDWEVCLEEYLNDYYKDYL